MTKSTNSIRRASPTVRFWSKVRPEVGDACWLWTDNPDRDGYGILSSKTFRTHPRGSPHRKAHRFSWEIHYGPIPDGLCVCHRCDNRLCVRPDHLFLGTNQDNTADRDSKGRMARGSRQGPSKLSEVDVAAIRARRASGEVYKTIAADYGVTVPTIWKVCTANDAYANWRHV